jgi:hypothetical protein
LVGLFLKGYCTLAELIRFRCGALNIEIPDGIVVGSQFGLITCEEINEIMKGGSQLGDFTLSEICAALDMRDQYDQLGDAIELRNSRGWSVAYKREIEPPAAKETTKRKRRQWKKWTVPPLPEPRQAGHKPFGGWVTINMIARRLNTTHRTTQWLVALVASEMPDAIWEMLKVRRGSKTSIYFSPNFQNAVTERWAALQDNE